MKKLFLTVLVALSLGTVAYAQEDISFAQPGSHITLGGTVSGGGLWLSGSQSDVTKLGIGLGGELTYAYFFTNNIGIRIGGSLNLIQSGFQNSEAVTSESTVPVTMAGTSMLMNANYWYTCPDVTERYFSIYGMVPVQIALQGDRWYANLGVKFAVPVRVTCTEYSYAGTDVYYTGSTKASAGVPTGAIYESTTAGASGSYSLFNYKDLGLLGGNGNFVKPFFVMGSAELGYRFGCDCGHSWQIGCFADIAINSIHPENAPASANGYLNYATNPSNGPTATHNYARGVMRTDLVNSFRLVNFGVKLSYDWALSKKN